jgi:hypothetical protein
MADIEARKRLIVIGLSVAAIIGIVAWIFSSGSASAERGEQQVGGHARDLEAAAEAADNAAGRVLNPPKSPAKEEP